MFSIQNVNLTFNHQADGNAGAKDFVDYLTKSFLETAKGMPPELFSALAGAIAARGQAQAPTQENSQPNPQPQGLMTFALMVDDNTKASALHFLKCVAKVEKKGHDMKMLFDDLAAELCNAFELEGNKATTEPEPVQD